MKKQFPIYSFLNTKLSTFLTTFKTLQFGFQEMVEQINASIKKNSDFITKTNTTEKDVLSFTDSIPKPESSTEKLKFISDFCPLKNSRPLKLFVLKKVKINFPFIK